MRATRSIAVGPGNEWLAVLAAAAVGAYPVTCLMIAIAPGPGVLYIVTRSLRHGRRSSIASVAGVALGNLGNAIVASIGLAALFAASALAFEMIKYAGALYLVFLGLRTLRTPPTPQGLQTTRAEHRAVHIFRDGFFVAFLNPKTAVFFRRFCAAILEGKRVPDVAELPSGLAICSHRRNHRHRLRADSAGDWSRDDARPGRTSVGTLLKRKHFDLLGSLHRLYRRVSR